MNYREYKKLCKDVMRELGVSRSRAIHMVNRLLARGVRFADVFDVIADGMTVAEYRAEYAGVLF
jgi:hypothetical protein